MSECIHSLCENNIKKKLFYCQKKVKNENLCCKKCNKREDLVVCLRSMIVYCKNENHYLKKHHVLFYDMAKKVMICTYCDKITHIITKDVNKDCLKKVKINLKNNFIVTDEHVQKNDFKFEKDEDTLLCNFIKLPRFPHKVLQGNIIKGFQNLGNTCYINSLFHILINISRFKRGIINENHPFQSCGTCIICNIKLIIKKMNTEKDLTLKHLVNCIMNFSSEYKNDDQHDIHTLYLNVVENIQKYINKIEGNSFIDQLFYGNMNSTLRCLSCDFKRHTIEAFCSISLNHTKNLKDSLSEYFQDEHMEDKLNCLNCKDYTVFSKSLEVIQIPEILVIHILRFEFINTITKINNGIEIYEKIEFGRCNYVLKGFVQHRGSIEQGHYLSYIRFGTFWYEFDDNNVRKLSHKNVPFQDAYLLFYIKDKFNENVLI